MYLGGLWRLERQGGPLGGRMGDCGQGTRGEAAVTRYQEWTEASARESGKEETGSLDWTQVL